MLLSTYDILAIDLAKLYRQGLGNGQQAQVIWATISGQSIKKQIYEDLQSAIRSAEKPADENNGGWGWNN